MPVAIIGNMVGQVLSVRGRRLVALAACLAIAFVVGARHFAGARAPAAAPVAPAIAVAEEPRARLTVHVVGAVRRPGLYRFRDGGRVADAVRRAGGATRKADLSLINLAAPLADGLQVVVPRRTPVAAGGAAAAAAVPGGPVHLNTATAEQLDELPGVGPVTAERIIDYREQNGGFTSVDELDAVPGIGPARLETLRELVAP
ncbi:MAG: ComEA family DNA-binding protein [Thermoleophilia bacterium]|nr:ComEA family DNA-binding protein [Thermoleophilia bacterium]